MKEQTREYTKKDFENVIERFLYSKSLNDNDKKVLENLPFCLCTAFSENPRLKERYEQYLWKVAESNIVSIDALPEYILLEVEQYTDWYHPEYDMLPPLENANLVSVTFANGETKYIKDTLFNVEKTLLKGGYRFIRTHGYSSKAVYFKDC